MNYNPRGSIGIKTSSYSIPAPCNLAAVARDQKADAIEVMRKQALNDAEIFTQKINSLEGQIVTARRDRKVAEIKAKRLVELLEELRQLKEDYDLDERPAANQEPPSPLPDSAPPPRSTSRFIGLTAIALLIAAAGGYLLYVRGALSAFL